MVRVSPECKQQHAHPNNINGCICKSKRACFDKDDFKYTALCNKCGRRILDVSFLPEQLTMIRAKCPHCKKLVITPLVEIDITGQMILAVSI